MLTATIKTKTGTTEEWSNNEATNTPRILAKGELALEITPDNSYLLKVGNGKDKFSNLPYVNDYNRVKPLLDKYQDLDTYFDSVMRGEKIATHSQNGLMSNEDKIKLDNIAKYANRYLHPISEAFSGRVHMTNIGDWDMNDIEALNAELQNKVYSSFKVDAYGHIVEVGTNYIKNADYNAAGLMSADDKKTLDNLKKSQMGVVEFDHNGLMSSEDYLKLLNIEAYANHYVHPQYYFDNGGEINNQRTPSFQKIQLDAMGHVIKSEFVTPNDLGTLAISAIGIASNTDNGLMSTDMYRRLMGLQNYVLPQANEKESVLGGVKVYNYRNQNEFEQDYDSIRGRNIWAINGSLYAKDTTYSNASAVESGLLTSKLYAGIEGVNNESSLNIDFSDQQVGSDEKKILAITNNLNTSIASGYNNKVEGLNNIISGSNNSINYTDEEGVNTFSNNNFVTGENNVISGKNKLVTGRYNSDEDAYLIVGNGTADNKRSNVLAVNNEEVKVTGTVKANVIKTLVQGKDNEGNIVSSMTDINEAYAHSAKTINNKLNFINGNGEKMSGDKIPVQEPVYDIIAESYHNKNRDIDEIKEELENLTETNKNGKTSTGTKSFADNEFKFSSSMGLTIDLNHCVDNKEYVFNINKNKGSNVVYLNFPKELTAVTTTNKFYKYPANGGNFANYYNNTNLGYKNYGNTVVLTVHRNTEEVDGFSQYFIIQKIDAYIQPDITEVGDSARMIQHRTYIRSAYTLDNNSSTDKRDNLRWSNWQRTDGLIFPTVNELGGKVASFGMCTPFASDTTGTIAPTMRIGLVSNYTQSEGNLQEPIPNSISQSVSIGAGLFYPTLDNNMSLGSSTNRWSQLFASKSVIQTSDKKSKTNIQYDIDKYLELYRKLEPCSFNFISGDRVHLGFIAQDVEKIMNEEGISDTEASFLCKDIIDDYHTYQYISDDDNEDKNVKTIILSSEDSNRYNDIGIMTISNIDGKNITITKILVDDNEVKFNKNCIYNGVNGNNKGLIKLEKDKLNITFDSVNDTVAIALFEGENKNLTDCTIKIEFYSEEDNTITINFYHHNDSIDNAYNVAHYTVSNDPYEHKDCHFIYGLRYTEFIPLVIADELNLRNKVNDLEEKVNKLLGN